MINKRQDPCTMASRTRPLDSKLTFQQANAICQSFLPAGERILEYGRALRELGFEAWVPYHEFIESFGNEREIEIHRRCLIEQAKLRLGVPWPFAVPPGQEETIFSSSFLNFLREARDEANGVPEDKIGQFYPKEGWRREIDPCQRNKVRFELNSPSDYEEAWVQVLEHQRNRLVLESEIHSSELARAYTFDRRGRYSLFTAAMEFYGKASGFHFDKSRSKPNFPLISKPITNEWDICWAIEEPKTFFLSPFEGRFAPYLEVRKRSLGGTVEEAESGEFILIRYQHIVPGFGHAYWKFFDLTELETMIKAHLYFYNLMAPIIENGLKKVLGGGDSAITR
jgi:hypothetical protein